jgi:signal transduction histidine kinase
VILRVWRRVQRRRLELVLGLAFVIPILVGVAVFVLYLGEQARSAHTAATTESENRTRDVTAALRSPPVRSALSNPIALDQPDAQQRRRYVVLPQPKVSIDPPDLAHATLTGYGCGFAFADGSSLCVAVGSGDASLSTVYVTGTFVAPTLRRFVKKEFVKPPSRRKPYWSSGNSDIHTWYLDLYRTADAAPERFFLPAQVPVLKDGSLLEMPGLDLFRWPTDGKGRVEKGSRARVEQGPCIAPDTDDDTCRRKTSFAIAIPRSSWDRTSAAPEGKPTGEAADLLIALRVTLGKEPVGSAALFASDAQGTMPGATAVDIRKVLRAGEKLELIDSRRGRMPVVFEPEDAATPRLQNWPERLGNRILTMAFEYTGRTLPGGNLGKRVLDVSIPVPEIQAVFWPAQARINPTYALSAGYAAVAMVTLLVVTLVAGVVVDFLVIRRARALTQRAVAVRQSMKNAPTELRVDFADLSGHRDELGALARTIQRLVERVQEDIETEKQRAGEEVARQRDRADFEIRRSREISESSSLVYRRMAHDMMTPLMSLQKQHDNTDVLRMHRAVQFFRGIEVPVALEVVDVVSWIAGYATRKSAVTPDVNIVVSTELTSLDALFDDAALPDALDHIVNNAIRFRTPGTPIKLTIRETALEAVILVDNVGPPISADPVEQIFDLAYSNNSAARYRDGNLGQGLPMARYWLGRIGGTVSASNTVDGASFEIRLRRPA